MKNNFYADLLAQTHVLIAGATGSGKSVIINGMIATALEKPSWEVQFILIDPKRVELSEYRNLPHTIKYASEPDDMVDALESAIAMTEIRYSAMQEAGLRQYIGSHVYVIIDELADLMTTDKKRVMPLIQRLCQIGRAAGISVVAATQCPLASVIPTAIKVNFDTRVALHTVTAQHSRNIMEKNGCETLPRYGKAYYMTPEGFNLIDVPMIADADRRQVVAKWRDIPKPTPKPVPTPEPKPEPKPEPVPAQRRKGFFARLFA